MVGNHRSATMSSAEAKKQIEGTELVLIVDTSYSTWNPDNPAQPARHYPTAPKEKKPAPLGVGSLKSEGRGANLFLSCTNEKCG